MPGPTASANTDRRRTWSRADRQTLMVRLRRAGFAEDERAPWLATRHEPTLTRQVQLAKEWRAHGFTSHEAVQWEEAGFDPPDATRWATVGFSPLQAEYARYQIVRREQHGDVARMLRDETAWQSSGIPPLWICRCLGGGVTTVEEGEYFYRQSATDPTVEPGLRLLAALGGWDFSYLEQRCNA